MSTALFDPIKTQSKVTDSVIVAFSGGKESIVTLDLCCKHFKNVKAFFLYIVPDLSFQEKTISWYENKYDIQITRLPHMETSQLFKYGCFRKEDYTIPIISINDIYKYVRLKNEMWWVAAGERINDSIVRRAMMKKSGSVDVQRGRFYPVINWNKREILDYIKFHKLYLGTDSRAMGHSWKGLLGEDMLFLKENLPDDYEKVLKIYPFAAGLAKRCEIYGKK